MADAAGRAHLLLYTICFNCQLTFSPIPQHKSHAQHISQAIQTNHLFSATAPPLQTYTK
jgi:hypothetical protein